MFSSLRDSSDIFVIAEVGQNHNGDLELARKFIKTFSDKGASAVKFQTRNNRYLFSEDAYCKPYNSENAFGSTYGEHRENLELGRSDLIELRDECWKNGVKFMSTPFDEPSLELLLEIDTDILKVASFDLGNLPFLDLLAKSGKPVVMSVGGGKLEYIQPSVEVLIQHNSDVVILHCVSEYPCEYNRLGLNNIEALKGQFPNCTIGSSDHFNGILSGPVAFMKGARVFEKHVTLNRAWKGTDQSFALEPDGFGKFVRDIKRVPLMLPPKSEEELGSEAVFKKLGKSLIAACDIAAGEEITLSSLSGRIFSDQIIPVRESVNVIGKHALKPIVKGTPIAWELIE